MSMSLMAGAYHEWCATAWDMRPDHHHGWCGARSEMHTGGKENAGRWVLYHEWYRNLACA